VGGATGMGAAAAQLTLDAGAEVVVMDFADVTLEGARAIHVNLAEKDSIDAAIAEHEAWKAAGRPGGTVSHEAAMAELLGGGQ